MIEMINLIEIVFIAIMVVDILIKAVSHIILIKANITDTKKNGLDNGIQNFYFDEPLTYDPFKNDGGLFIIKADYIVMDAVFVVLIIVMFVI